MPNQSDAPDDLAREIERLRRELKRADRDRIRLERERDRLQRENERLQQALDLARRAAKRAAAPFSKGPPKRHPRRPGRRAGRDYGRHGQRARPAPIDDVIPVGLPAACPHCAGAVEMTRVAAQYQEELPDVRPLVRRFDVAIGRCTACGRRLQGRHPLQTSNALGAAGVQLGPQAVALMVQLNKQLGLSHGKIATLLRDRFAVAVTSSTVTRALHRAARQARPTYVALCETIRGSPVVAPDETSWRVNGHGHWLWAFATPETTVYAIQPGRGFTQAAGILGAEYAGVLVRDGWAPYRQFTAAAHHTCLAHLLRRCRDLRQDHPRAQFARRVQAALQQALRIRDRRDAGTISRHGAAVARGHVTTRLHTALDHVGPLPAMRRFAAHLSVELPALFSFLFDPAVDATNWRAEQALRPAVVNRKVSGGNRTARGADTQQVLTSVLRTAQQRHLDASAILVDLLSRPTAHWLPPPRLPPRNVTPVTSYLRDYFAFVQLDEDAHEWLTELNLDTPRVNLNCLSSMAQLKKRALDVATSACLLVFLSPVIAIAALLVRATSRGPVIFKQERVGIDLRLVSNRRRGGDAPPPDRPDRRQNDGASRRATVNFGKPFVLFKFRTMYLDAETAGAQFAVENDPRVTPVGGFLRRTRIDELPQLWNVLKGEMSMVGPRPERPQFIQELSDRIPRYVHRLRLRPGLTGIAQVLNGYDNQIDGFRRKVAYDLLYLQNACFRNDMKIMMRTVWVVLTGKGAI